MSVQPSDSSERGVKRVQVALWTLGAIGVIAAITGVQKLSFASDFALERHAPQQRLGVGLLGLAMLTIAYGCQRRRRWGWWSVAGLLVAFIALAAWHVAVSMLQPWPEPMFGLLYALVQIGPAVLLLSWWRHQRAAFSMTNATSAAPGAPPRTPSLGDRFAVLFAITICFIVLTWFVVLFRHRS